MAQNQTFVGSVYPEAGLSTYEQSLLEGIDFSETSGVNPSQAMNTGASNVKSGNVWMGFLALIAILVIMHLT